MHTIANALARQVKALHMDVEFILFNKTAARGVLPELWGLVPRSEATAQMLSRH